jgi:flagellar biosynthetic protein FliR
VKFAATYTVNAIGLGGVPGQPLADQEAESTVSSILSLGFIALILATDLHFATIKALLSSYALVPMGEILDVRLTMPRTLTILSRTSVISLQMASPFMVLSVIMNFALGVANRLTPQLSVFFAFTGLLTMASLAVLAAASPTMLLIATDAYREFLERGFQ